MTPAPIWSTHEARRIGIRRAWRFRALALLFGLAGTLPLFLWTREGALAAAR